MELDRFSICMHLKLNICPYLGIQDIVLHGISSIISVYFFIASFAPFVSRDQMAGCFLFIYLFIFLKHQYSCHIGLASIVIKFILHLFAFLLSLSDSCRHLDFRVSMAFDGHRLINHVIRTIEFVERDFCGALCYMEHNCISYNMEIIGESSTARKCELNNSTHNEHPEDLRPWNNYVYQ